MGCLYFIADKGPQETDKDGSLPGEIVKHEQDSNSQGIGLQLRHAT